MRKGVLKSVTAVMLSLSMVAGNIPLNLTGNSAGSKEKVKNIYHVYADEQDTDYDFQMGDINGDGTIDIKDSALLKRYLAGWDVEINEITANINGDEMIDIKDSALLKRYLAGWEVEFAKPVISEEIGNIIIKVDGMNSYGSVITNEEKITVSGNIKGTEKLKKLSAEFSDKEGNVKTVEISSNDISKDGKNNVEWSTEEISLNVGSNTLTINAQGEEGTEVSQEVILYRNSSELEFAENVVVFGTEYEDEMEELKEISEKISDIETDSIEEQTYHLVVDAGNPLCGYIKNGDIKEGDLVYIPENDYFLTGMTFRYVSMDDETEDENYDAEQSEIIHVEVPEITELFAGEGCIASDKLNEENPIAFIIGPDGLSLDGVDTEYYTSGNPESNAGMKPEAGEIGTGFIEKYYYAGQDLEISNSLVFDTGKSGVTKKGFQISAIKPTISKTANLSKGSIKIGFDGIIIYDADGDVDQNGKTNVTTDDRIVVSGSIGIDDITPVFGMEWGKMPKVPKQVIDTMEYKESVSAKLTLGKSVTKGNLSEILKSAEKDYENEARFLNNKIALSGVDMEGTLLLAAIGYKLGEGGLVKGTDVKTIRETSECIPVDPILIVTVYVTLEGEVKINSAISFDYTSYVKKGTNVQKEGFKGAFGTCEENKGTAKGCTTTSLEGYQIDRYDVQAKSKTQPDKTPEFAIDISAEGEGSLTGEIGFGLGVMMDGIIPVFLKAGLQASANAKLKGVLSLVFSKGKNNSGDLDDESAIELEEEELKKALTTKLNAIVDCSLDFVGSVGARIKVEKVKKEDKSGDHSKDEKKEIFSLSYDEELFKINIAKWGISNLNFKGTIVDSETKEKITDAKVTLTKNGAVKLGNMNKKETVAIDGEYSFENCTDDTYTLTIEKDGYDTYVDKNFKIASGKNIFDEIVADEIEMDKVLDYKKAFYDYIGKELVPKYGMADLEQTGTMYGESTPWLHPRGIISAEISDLDGDDKDEMLLVYVKYKQKSTYALMMDVYEIENRKVKLASSMSYGAYIENSTDTWLSDKNLYANLYQEYDVYITLVKEEEVTYIVCEEQKKVVNGGGTRVGFWILNYNEGKLNYVASFTQTYGLTEHQKYTGYYFENGKCVYSKLLCGWVTDVSESAPAYQYFDDALASLFNVYGIEVNKSKYGLGLFDESILSEKNDMVKITRYDVNNTDSDYKNKKYAFEANVSDYTDVRSNITVEDGWIYEYVNILYGTYDIHGNNLRYAIGYIDEDDIPELFVMNGSYHSGQVEVYSYYDKNVSKLGSYGSFGMFSYIPYKNSIYSWYEGQGNQFSNYYKIVNGKSVREAHFAEIYNWNLNLITYEVDDEQVTKEEYEEKLIKYMSNISEHIGISYDEVSYSFSTANMKKFIQNPSDFINPNEK